MGMTVELAAIVLLAVTAVALQFELRSARQQYDANMGRLLDSYAKLAMSRSLSEYVSADNKAPLKTLAPDDVDPDDPDGELPVLPFSLRGDN